MEQLNDTTPQTNPPAPVGDVVRDQLADLAKRGIRVRTEADVQRDQERELQRRRGLAVRALEQQLGPRYGRSCAGLEQYEIYHEAQAEVVARLRYILEHELAGMARDGQSMIFSGTVGTGKDHLLAASLYAACERGYSCDWTDGLTFYAKFRDGIKRGDLEQDLLKAYLKPDIFAISDPVPPAGQVSDYGLQMLKRAVDERYRFRKPTWLTLNAKDPEEAAGALTSVVFDRLADGAETFACFWPSYREVARKRAKERREQGFKDASKGGPAQAGEAPARRAQR